MTERGPGFILAFMLMVTIVLVGLSLIVPQKGVRFALDFELKYPSFDRLVNNESPDYVDIASTIALSDSLDEVGEISDEELEIALGMVDTTDSVIVIRRKHINVDSMRRAEKYLQPIEFENGDASSLISFFEALDDVAYKKGKTHVFHYGDSQIEGDRMTSYIRDRLQKRFGGYAIGMVPVSNLNQVKILNHENSEGWYRYPAFFKEGAEGENSNYGAMASYSTYTPYPTDSSLAKDSIYSAWVRYDTKKTIYNNAKKFKQVKIFHGPVYDAVRLTFPIYDTTFTDYLKGQKILNTVSLDFDEPIDQVELKFESKISPQIYGVALESPTGVQVNNIAMRGSSGTIFHKIDPALFAAMHEELNTSLIILQYGGNVMPYMKDSVQAAQYGSRFYNQIRVVQKSCPNASIVLIGPSDMSTKNDEFFETYPLLEPVRDALKKAAFKAGIGYWDMYAAMGGKNSMPSWVEASPALAGSDYTHFTPRGARIISEFFYKALIIEYETYNNSKLANDDSSQHP
jgi:lysophospholipase L1-like esterase